MDAGIWCVIDIAFQINRKKMKYMINVAERSAKRQLEPTSYHSKNKLLISEIINKLENL